MINLDKMEELYGEIYKCSSFDMECVKFDESIEELKRSKNDREELTFLIECCINLCGVYHFAENIGYLLLAGLDKAFGLSPEVKAKVEPFVEEALRSIKNGKQK